MKRTLAGFTIALFLAMLHTTTALGDFYVINTGRANYKNILVVAKSGAKFSSIQAALDSIDDASDSNRYLVQVAPGLYSERITMKSYVDIAGCGPNLTTISSQGSASEYTATVTGANNAELRDLKVSCYNLIVQYAYTIAIRNDNASPRLINLNIKATGGTQLSSGIVNDDRCETFIKDVIINVTGPYSNYGVQVTAISEVIMESLKVYVSGGGLANRGVYVDNSSAKISNVLSIPTGSGSYGFYNRLHQTSGYIVLDNVNTYEFIISPEHAIYNTLGADVRVYNSKLIGSVSAVTNYQVDGYGTTTSAIANTMLSGSADGGEFTCFGCYDYSLASLDANCQ